MRIFTGFHPVLLLLLIAGISIAKAAEVTNNPTPVPTSNAVAFATQAGYIAGAAQGCGQNIAPFVSRVNEALNKLALSATDKLLAISVFQKNLQSAQTEQITQHPIPCTQVMQDFNNLPIMRSDYEQTVIAQLNPMMGTSTPPPVQNTTVSPAIPPANSLATPPVGVTMGPPAAPTPPAAGIAPITSAPANSSVANPVQQNSALSPLNANSNQPGAYSPNPVAPQPVQQQAPSATSYPQLNANGSLTVPENTNSTPAASPVQQPNTYSAQAPVQQSVQADQSAQTGTMDSVASEGQQSSNY